MKNHLLSRRILQCLSVMFFLSPLITVADDNSASAAMSGNSEGSAACASWLNHSIKELHTKRQINLCEVAAGKPLLIINTASHCGFTRQFKGLEEVYQNYKDQGLVVIGFPSNDFKQEAESEAETAKICRYNFGVTFMMTTHVSIKGDDAHPVFQHLGQQQGEPSWNFNKYVVDRNGKVTERFSNFTSPSASSLNNAIKLVL